ncbi:MAG TPA: cyclic nucleotide-binding domain-containing protein, partial [Kofleriaceae bacterium]|nr:cyclic nucleotide-binding domain-containing protein [Kofleriaceae bacterium]
GPGALVGERALFEATTHAATLRAAELTELLVLDRATFEAALDRWPELRLAVSRPARAAADRT